jgi:enoyl-CoA hydratase
MNFENILVSSENGIGQITINRPSKLNALNKATIQELHDALENLDANHDIRTSICCWS